MSRNSTKKRLKRRLTWSSQVEGMNAVMFFGIMIFLNMEYEFNQILFLTYGLLMMCFILFQGTYYWWIKLERLNEKRINQPKLINRFSVLKKWNFIGLILMPVFLLLQWFLSGQNLGSDNLIGWAIFANFFALLEHINYYYKQLMYDNKHDLQFLIRNKSLKEASLYKDLRENKI